MERFCVDKKTDTAGTHRVHRLSCEHLPKPESRHDLGGHANSYSALIAARRYYFSCLGCDQCCPECADQREETERSAAR